MSENVLEGVKYIAVTKDDGQLVALLDPRSEDISCLDGYAVVVSYSNEAVTQERDGQLYLANLTDADIELLKQDEEVGQDETNNE